MLKICSLTLTAICKSSSTNLRANVSLALSSVNKIYLCIMSQFFIKLCTCIKMCVVLGFFCLHRRQSSYMLLLLICIKNKFVEQVGCAGGCGL